jgi:hypothetical protein
VLTILKRSEKNKAESEGNHRIYTLSMILKTLRPPMTQGILESYQNQIAERQKMGIPPRPLNAEQVKALSELVLNPPEGKEELILKLLKEHVPPGVDPAAFEKAKLLRNIALREKTSKILSPHDAVRLLGTMKGGYNIETLMDLLDDEELSGEAAFALSNTILIFGFFDKLKELARFLPFRADRQFEGLPHGNRTLSFFTTCRLLELNNLLQVRIKAASSVMNLARKLINCHLDDLKALQDVVELLRSDL